MYQSLPRSGKIITGFHGTDAETARKIVNTNFITNYNDHGFLGYGTYFFEDVPKHAFDWANIQRGVRRSEVAIIQADFILGQCLNLLDEENVEFIRSVGLGLYQKKKFQGNSVRVFNEGVAINLLAQTGFEIDSVKSLLTKGKYILDEYDFEHGKPKIKSNFRETQHILYCVRNTENIQKNISLYQIPQEWL